MGEEKDGEGNGQGKGEERKEKEERKGREWKTRYQKALNKIFSDSKPLHMEIT